MDLDFSFLFAFFSFLVFRVFCAFALATPPSLLFWCSWVCVVRGGAWIFLWFSLGFFFFLFFVFSCFCVVCFVVLVGWLCLVVLGVCLFFFLFWKRPPCVRSVFGCWLWTICPRLCCFPFVRIVLLLRLGCRPLVRVFRLLGVLFVSLSRLVFHRLLVLFVLLSLFVFLVCVLCLVGSLVLWSLFVFRSCLCRLVCLVLCGCSSSRRGGDVGSFSFCFGWL